LGEAVVEFFHADSAVAVQVKAAHQRVALLRGAVDAHHAQPIRELVEVDVFVAVRVESTNQVDEVG